MSIVSLGILVCDAQRLNIDIPSPCRSRKLERCRAVLGKFHTPVELFLQNALYAHSICLYHEHMELERRHMAAVEAHIALAEKDRELTRQLMQKSEELAAVQNRMNEALTRQMSTVSDMLTHMGQQVVTTHARVLQDVKGLGEQVNEAVADIKDANNRFMEEVKSSGWGISWFWPAIDMIEQGTGWSRANAMAVAAVAGCVCVYACSRMDGRQRLGSIAIVAIISGGFSHRQAILAIIAHRWMPVSTAAATSIACGVGIWCVVSKRRPYQRQFDPTPYIEQYYGEEYADEVRKDLSPPSEIATDIECIILEAYNF